MKLKGFKWWHPVLFGAVFALSAAAMVPAQWVGTALNQATDGRVRLVAATGFPWNGRGDVVVRVNGSDIVLRGTTWRWLPSRLAVGDLAIELSFDGSTATGSAIVARRATSFIVREADIGLSAAVLAESIGRLRDWQPGGRLSFRTQGLALKDDGIAGNAELIWQGAATSIAPLGDYRFIVHAEHGGTAQLELATLRGPLYLAASGDYGPSAGFRLRGTATPDAEYRARLLPLLSWLGSDRGDGAIFFDIALPPGGAA